MFELRPLGTKRNASIWDPWRDFADLERNFFGGMHNFGASFRTDLIDNGGSYTLEAELPGFDKGDIKIDIENDVLTIHAEHKSEKEEKGEDESKYVYKERGVSSYSRSFDISGIESDGISASYDKGILKVELPKASVEKPAGRHVAID